MYQWDDTSAQAVNECLRDIVALSTLPSLWSGAEPARIVESLAVSLFSILRAEFVFLSFTDESRQSSLTIAQTDRRETNPSLALQIGAPILEWAKTHDPEDLLVLPHPSRDGNVHVAFRSLGFNAELGVVAAAFLEPSAITPAQHLILNVVATQGAIALDNAFLVRALREREADLRNRAIALKESEAATRLLAQQQRSVASLGVTALQETDSHKLFDHAVQIVRDTLDIDLCKVLELDSDGSKLLLRAGVGWRAGLVGEAVVSVGPDSQAGYTLISNEPVIVHDLSKETRFRGPALLLDHHVVSGMSCIIWGANNRPWGVLGAHSTIRRSFTKDDVAFLQGIANVLAASIQRRAIEQELRESEDKLRAFAGKLEDVVAERTRQLVHSRERLRALATELNLAEQRERRRLANELHDHLQQLLVLGRIKLGQAKRLVDSTHVATLVEETDELFTQALRYTRTLVAELSPVVLREHGIAAGLKWLGEYMKKHGLEVRVEVPGHPLDIPEDQAVLLFQSVRELLFNCSKHAQIQSATVTLLQYDDQLLIQVRDEGIGFNDSDDMQDQSQHAKFGLYSIQERMQALGGSFKIDSAPGRGTRASITLPYRSSASLSSPQAILTGQPTYLVRPPRMQTCSRKIRVLLVDDHVMVRQGLRAVLDGYDMFDLVGEVGNGEEAIALVSQLRPAVVVMDINMPKINGIDATRQIKSQYPEIQVIGLSVNADDHNQIAMVDAGASLLLTKEAAVEQLHNAIQEVMRQERPSGPGLVKRNSY